jgi:nucleotide-binding universal stress UspA family protein
MFRRILCPVDFSALSRRALQHAARLARQTGAELTVLHVDDPLLEAAARTYGRRTARASTLTQLQQFADRVLAGAETKPRSKVTCTCVVAVGDPAEQIQKTARRLKSDLVVMGTHGLTGLAKVMFGSTTEQFLRIARVPVMLIPRSAKATL